MSKIREFERTGRALQQTTLIEYLYNCHFQIYTKLRLSEDKRTKSSGLATAVNRKYYPKLLRPWDDFSTNQHPRHFNKIQSVCGEARRFEDEIITREKGIEIEEDDPAGSEECIGIFERIAVRRPVSKILSVLQKDQTICQQFQFSQLCFRKFTRGTERLSKERSQRKKLLGIPDGYGIRTSLDGTESLAFVYDYKAAHKFSTKHLGDILKNEKLFIEVTQRKVVRGRSPNKKLRNQQAEEERIAMALAQLFHYMISYGVAYGYIAAGKCMVLLHLDPTKPQTLYYHLCIPDKEVSGESSMNKATQMSHTAVAKLASFCLLSLRSKALVGDAHSRSLQQAKEDLKEWGTCYDDMGQQCKSKEKGKDTDEEAGQGQGGDFSRSQTLDDAHPHIEPTKQYSKDQDASLSTSIWEVSRQYCTQACLLGLKRGGHLDENCPNITSHRATTGSTRHAINAGQFTRMVRNQLRRNPYRHCVPLDNQGKYGAIGVLFKLELAPYGYTFVGKGTWRGFVGRLKHEMLVYERLGKLQGDVVPVHLGMVHFHEGYVLPGADRVCDMMLISWGGEEVEDIDTLEAEASLKAIRAAGILHNDERCHNMLWNAERSSVMITDFDRSRVSGEDQEKRKRQKGGSKSSQV